MAIDARGLNLIENLRKDFRFALRQLRKNPAFTCTGVFVLALGMCASLAIFAFVDAVLVRPLPYRNPSRLVAVYEINALFPRSNLSYPDYLDWRQRNRSFGSLDVYQQTGFTLSTPGGAQPAHGARVSAAFFRTLGVTPMLGRDFYPGEDRPAAPRSALLLAPHLGTQWTMYPLGLTAGWLCYLGYHAVDEEWKRRGAGAALFSALTGAAGAAAIQRGAQALFR